MWRDGWRDRMRSSRVQYSSTIYYIYTTEGLVQTKTWGTDLAGFSTTPEIQTGKVPWRIISLYTSSTIRRLNPNYKRGISWCSWRPLGYMGLSGAAAKCRRRDRLQSVHVTPVGLRVLHIDTILRLRGKFLICIFDLTMARGPSPYRGMNMLAVMIEHPNPAQFVWPTLNRSIS